MKRKRLRQARAVLAIGNGVICIAFASHIYRLLPTICGLILLASGCLRLIEGIRNKDYASLEQVGMERAIVMMAVGVGVLVKQQNALFVVGVFWGLAGLRKASNFLNEALYYMYQKEKYAPELMKCILSAALSMLLIFDPFGKIGVHIVILGVEMIVDTLIEWTSPRKEELQRS
ncbi:MAG: DUF308 domain-containing protein [Oscillospiraceae bacterium]|nr:DUF308 domain-containing protein [Oscillospiraceae bacterium]